MGFHLFDLLKEAQEARTKRWILAGVTSLCRPHLSSAPQDDVERIVVELSLFLMLPTKSMSLKSLFFLLCVSSQSSSPRSALTVATLKEALGSTPFVLRS